MSVQMSETTSPRRIVSYRLCVIAPDVADVVRSAGGWLFDQVIQGWDVNVLVDPDCDDVRPLRILGVRTRPLDHAFEWLTDPPEPLALAAAADVLARDAQVRRGVRKALNRGLAEVTLWGDAGPSKLECHGESVHVLSAAAKAFKTQAVMAAGCPRESAGSAETLRTATSLPVLSSLTPVR